MAEVGAQCGDLAAGTCHLTILVILAVPPCSTFLNKDGFGMALELPQSLEKQGIFHIARLRWLPFFFGACLSQFVAQQAESGRCFILSKLDTQFCLDHDPSLMRLGHHDLGPDHWIPLA